MKGLRALAIGLTLFVLVVAPLAAQKKKKGNPGGTTLPLDSRYSCLSEGFCPDSADSYSDGEAGISNDLAGDTHNFQMSCPIDRGCQRSFSVAIPIEGAGCSGFLPGDILSLDFARLSIINLDVSSATAPMRLQFAEMDWVGGEYVTTGWVYTLTYPSVAIVNSGNGNVQVSSLGVGDAVLTFGSKRDKNSCTVTANIDFSTVPQ